MSDFQHMKHLKKPRISKKDEKCLLKDVFEQQIALLGRYPFYKAQTPEQLTKTYALALVSEIGEMLDQVNWKSWKQTKKLVDQEELRYELIDLFTFVISLMIAWGMTEKECWAYFSAKNKENLSRIERGY